MATDRFLEICLAIAVGLLNAAFDHTVLIAETVHAHFPFNGRRYPAKFPVVHISAMTLNPPDTFFCQVRLYCFINRIEDLEFFFFQWGPGIAVLTTAAF